MAKKILVVDDEVELVQTLSQVLTERGFEVAGAHTGRDGLNAAKQGSPDLIILDLRLPDMDGWHVCQKLKADAKLGKVPVIMLSALVDDQYQKSELELGDAYLSKPFDMRRLLDMVRKHIGEQQ